MKSINFLIKPASSLCNLRCRYCFYADEAENRSQASMGLMSGGMAELLLQEAFRAVDDDGTVSFAFQGGEPTVI
ncbi:MAG: anaerobic sulfatase maturase, partial [Oscillospiraceae bacterium]|nr:anaerobic sulfatase maturase [Oscillospiraceae bacterium]